MGLGEGAGRLEVVIFTRAELEKSLRDNSIRREAVTEL